MSAPGDNLPRPATPGPWEASEPHDADCGSACTPNGCMGHPSGYWLVDGPPMVDAFDPPGFGVEADARAIAALPEWIAARDAEREGRLRAEARVRALEEALGEALEAAREPGAEEWFVDTRAYSRFALDTLSRRGFGGGS